MLNRLLSRFFSRTGDSSAQETVARGVTSAELQATPMADVVACIISTVLAIDEAVLDQLEQWVKEDAERRSRRFELRQEAIYFLAHLVSRLSFAAFGADARASIHAHVVPTVLDVFVRAGFPSMPASDIADLCSDLHTTLMERESEYGHLSYPSVDSLNITSSVVGLFADRLSDLVGNGELRCGFSPPTDPGAYMVMPLVVSNIVKQSELGRFVQAYGSQLSRASS